MRPEKLNYILSSISSLKGVGPKLELIINKLGIIRIFILFGTYQITFWKENSMKIFMMQKLIL